MTRARCKVVAVLARWEGAFACLEVGKSSLKIHLNIFSSILALHFEFWASVLRLSRSQIMRKSCSTAAVRTSVGDLINSWWSQLETNIRCSNPEIKYIQSSERTENQKINIRNLWLFCFVWFPLQKTSKSTIAIEIRRTKPPFSLHHKISLASDSSKILEQRMYSNLVTWQDVEKWRASWGHKKYERVSAKLVPKLCDKVHLNQVQDKVYYS